MLTEAEYDKLQLNSEVERMNELRIKDTDSKINSCNCCRHATYSRVYDGRKFHELYVPGFSIVLCDNCLKHLESVICTYISENLRGKRDDQK